MTAEYTIEQFIEEFEESQTPDAKQEVMSRLLDSDIYLVDNKELLIEYKAQIQDLREQLDIEEDIKINDLIDNGSMELFTCIKAVDEFVEGSSYYVQIDDYKSKLVAIEGVDIPDVIKDYLDGIKPLVWVANDRGIGTLKFRTLINFEFSEYFTK
jgi:viroplasmin and RNaseH domain-containing protein